MPITLDEVLELRRSVEADYRPRHDAFRRLRDCWHGDYWNDLDRAQQSGLASLYRDLTGRRHDVGPDVRIVHNVLQEICVKYQTYLSGLPQIQVFIDPPMSDISRRQATLKERSLYGLWSEPDRSGRAMTHIVNSAAWYLPLMGDCYLGIWPDFDRNIPRPVLRSPEYAYPIPDAEGTGTDALVFSWMVPESRAKRAYPNYTPQTDRKRSVRGRFSRKPGGSEPMVEIVEFSDSREWARWVDGQKVNGVQHDYGFNLFENLFFIHVPDEPFNHGAVEQIVGLVEAGNVLHSLLVQEVFETVFSPIVLENPMRFGETIDTGPGAVIPVNEGGRAYRLDPASGALSAHVGFLGVNEQYAKQGGSMPDVNFGVSPASSIVTGKAVNELQGAGTGSTVEMVQAVGIGQGLVAWNSKALYMLNRTFGEEQIYLHGTFPRSISDLKPQAFGLKFKGKQIVGSQRNEVIFSPHLNMHEKLVMGLQAAGAGLVSKAYQRGQIGIPDSEAMDEEIVTERIEDAVLGAMEQSLLAEPTPANAEQVEQEAVGFLAGAMPVSPPAGPAPAPALAALPGPPGPSGPPAEALPSGAAGPPAPALSPSLPGAAPPPALAPSDSGNSTLEEVSAALSQVQGLRGRVFLVGEIVQRGETSGDIEVALTVSDDRQVLVQGLPRYAKRMTFHVVSGEPSEPHLEVTPGAPEAAQASQPQEPVPA